MRRMPVPSRSRQVWSLVILGCCLAVPLALVACGRVSGTPGAVATASPTLTIKQAALATMAVQATALANGPHAQKHPHPVTPPASCPRPTPQPGIVDMVSLPPGGFADAIVDNSTAAAPADAPLYVLFIMAGSRRSNPKQGVLIVVRLLRDSCATTPTPNGDNFETYYNTPFQQGHVQMTGVAGDTVTFTTADGGSTMYRFDFVTGQFV